MRSSVPVYSSGLSDSRADPSREGPALRWQRALGLLLLGFVFWTSKLNVGVPLTQGRTDHSWCWVMIDAFRTGKAFGTDLVWTYGPLGGIQSGLWVAEIEPARMYLWEVGFKGLIAAITVALFLQVRGSWSRALFAVTYVLIPTEGNVWSMLAVAASAALLVARISRPWAQLLLTFPLAVLALEKMTGFVLAGACAAIAAAVLFLEKDRRGALRVAGSYASWMAILWCGVCRQSLLHFPMWVTRSMELAGGYSEAMSLDADPGVLSDGRRSVALALLTALAFVACGGRSWRALGALAAWLLAGFLAYKAGFVRALDHPMIYFLTIAPLAYVLLAPSAAEGARRVLPGWVFASLRHVLALHAFYTGLMIGAPNALALHERVVTSSFQQSLSVAYVRDPGALPKEYEPLIELAKKQFELPRVKSRVGDATIDVLPFQQGVAVLNGLKLHVRPVIASYATFTPRLAELNARFFERPDAPQFALLELMNLDYRAPTMDDAAALQVLARDYEPVACDMDDLLLQRRPDAPRGGFAERTTLLEREIAFDEVIDLPARGNPHVLALDVRYSLLGKLRTTVDQAPPLFARADLDDGRQVRFRVIPGILRGGIIFDPWIGGNVDWATWRSGGPVGRPVRLLIETPVAPWMYASTVTLRYVEAPDLAATDTPREALPCDTLFDTLPARIDPPTAGKPVTFPEGRARLLPAPSTMVFFVPAGRLRVTGFHGLVPRSYTKRKSDGARFSMTLVSDGRVLATAWEHTLDPRRVEADRGHQTIDVQVDVPESCELHIATDGGPSGDITDDWAYLGALRITDDKGVVVPGWIDFRHEAK